MTCKLSAVMTRTKCREMKRTSPGCVGCDGLSTRQVVLQLPFEIYGILRKAADEDGQDVSTVCEQIITLATSGNLRRSDDK